VELEGFAGEEQYASGEEVVGGEIFGMQHGVGAAAGGSASSGLWTSKSDAKEGSCTTSGEAA
jgi:hypothetical protein